MLIATNHSGATAVRPRYRVTLRVQHGARNFENPLRMGHVRLFHSCSNAMRNLYVHELPLAEFAKVFVERHSRTTR